MKLPSNNPYRNRLIQLVRLRDSIRCYGSWECIISDKGCDRTDLLSTLKRTTMVKSGKFGHQVNSVKRLQTVEIQMRRLLMSRLIRIFTVCLVNLVCIPIIELCNKQGGCPNLAVCPNIPDFILSTDGCPTLYVGWFGVELTTEHFQCAWSILPTLKVFFRLCFLVAMSQVSSFPCPKIMRT